MKILSQLAMGVLGAIVALGSVGCETKPTMGEFNVTVSLADGFNPVGSVEVDVVGVQDGRDLVSIEGISVSDYFGAMNPYRRDLDRKIGLVFRADTDREHRIDLTRRGPHYANWKNANVMHLVVLADLSSSGGPDLRRLTLPLDKHRWKRKNLEILIDATKVSSAYAPEPVKN